MFPPSEKGWHGGEEIYFNNGQSHVVTDSKFDQKCNGQVKYHFGIPMAWVIRNGDLEKEILTSPGIIPVLVKPGTGFLGSGQNSG